MILNIGIFKGTEKISYIIIVSVYWWRFQVLRFQVFLRYDKKKLKWRIDRNIFDW